MFFPPRPQHLAEGVTIVMPCFNASAFLKESIESILHQSVQNWRLIAIDDCSSDNTADILSHFSNLDSRISFIRNPKNQGPSSSRNKGIHLSKTEHTCFLDADDVMSPNSLEDRLTALTNNPVACGSYSHVKLVDSKGKQIGLNGTKQKIIGFVDLIENKFITSCILARTDLILKCKGFDERFRYGEDWDLWLKLTRMGFVFTLAENSHILYRQHHNSISHNNLHADLSDRLRVSAIAWGKDRRFSNQHPIFKRGLGFAIKHVQKTKKALFTLTSAVILNNFNDANKLLKLIDFEALRFLDPVSMADETKWSAIRNTVIAASNWPDFLRRNKTHLRSFMSECKRLNDSQFMKDYFNILINSK